MIVYMLVSSFLRANVVLLLCYLNNPRYFWLCYKHPPIFVFLSVGKSFSVTPKLVGFHRFSPTKLTDNLKKKLLIKLADFFGQEKSADFVVGGEIVWWDTSFRLHWILGWSHSPKL